MIGPRLARLLIGVNAGNTELLQVTKLYRKLP
jgi:hypothetical protein